MDYFQQHSHFQQMPPIPANSDPKSRIAHGQAEKTRQITNKQLEDWSLRLEACANEAQDEQLYPLESDLLDLRDEIVHELHRNLS